MKTRVLAAACVALAVACSTEPGDEGGLDQVGSGSVVGPEGAVVRGDGAAEGVLVEIPAGALDEPVTISIGAASTGFEPTPGVAGSPIFALEPHGQTFSEPVTIRIPHTLAPGDAVVWTSQPGGAWEKLASVDLGDHTEVQVAHFSFFFNGREVCGLARQECCTEPDDACAGPMLTCMSIASASRCIERGMEGEPCCGGVCYGTGGGGSALTCSENRCAPSGSGSGGAPM